MSTLSALALVRQLGWETVVIVFLLALVVLLVYQQFKP
jgi:hypothetical protein